MTRKSFVSRDSSYAVTFIKSGCERDHRIAFDAFEDMGIDGRITPRIKFPELRFVAECGGAVRMGVIGKTPAAHIDNNENAPETGTVAQRLCCRAQGAHGRRGRKRGKWHNSDRIRKCNDHSSYGLPQNRL